jgi:hypothetical protein
MPMILSRAGEPGVYLLFDHRAFLEKSSNVDWHLALLGWRQSHTGAGSSERQR